MDDVGVASESGSSLRYEWILQKPWVCLSGQRVGGHLSLHRFGVRVGSWYHWQALPLCGAHSDTGDRSALSQLGCGSSRVLSVVPLEPHHHLNMTKVSSRSKSLIKLCVACHDTRVEVRQELDPVTQGRACVLTMLLLMQVAYSLCLCGSMYAYVHMHMGAEARGQPRALFLRHCL